MLASAIASRLLAPQHAYLQQEPGLNLETLIPEKFGKWKIDPESALRLINPDTRGVQDKIYNQAIARTYINDKSQRVMLSVAYGGYQHSGLQVHRPEICYTAGGFNISTAGKSSISTVMGEIPVMHLLATQDNRIEYITYWIRVGNTLTRGWIQQKLAAIGYSLSGTTPDGLLFRVSSIASNGQDAFRIQNEFTNAVLQAIRDDGRHWLVGTLQPGQIAY